MVGEQSRDVMAVALHSTGFNSAESRTGPAPPLSTERDLFFLTCSEIRGKVSNLVKLSPRQRKKVFEEAGKERTK